MTWSIYSADGKFHWLRDDNGFVITAGEDEQRIRLLGAAPQMLEALKKIETLARRLSLVAYPTPLDWKVVRNCAHAAIAAAKGENDEKA